MHEFTDASTQLREVGGRGGQEEQGATRIFHILPAALRPLINVASWQIRLVLTAAQVVSDFRTIPSVAHAGGGWGRGVVRVVRRFCQSCVGKPRSRSSGSALGSNMEVYEPVWP